MTGRSFIPVAEEIKNYINSNWARDQKELEQLIGRLNKLIFNNTFRAPELQFIDWQNLRELLLNYINPLRSDWEANVFRIFTNFDGTLEEYRAYIKKCMEDQGHEI